MPKVCNPKHKAKSAVMWSYDQAVTEKNARGRTGEADKDETGDHCDPDHAEKDLDCDHDVAVNGRGIVMAVANRSEGFDAKEESLRK